MKANLWLSVLSLFALVTLFMSSSVIFDWFGIREMEGNYVPIVVWANLVASVLYLLSAYRAVTGKSKSGYPLIIALIILILAYIALGIHISSGGAYETKTVGAMAFRIILTSVFLLTHKKIFRK
ncbi:MAG: hypothetical protein K0M63_07410 [Weeksellaceae bacterium]|nr:hypothetical protein [Weeksellaceae bacterium]